MQPWSTPVNHWPKRLFKKSYIRVIITMFSAAWENIKGSNSLHGTKNLQPDIIKSKTHTICIGKHCFTVIFGISWNPAESVWYYRLPFLVKAETQGTVKIFTVHSCNSYLSLLVQCIRISGCIRYQDKGQHSCLSVVCMLFVPSVGNQKQESWRILVKNKIANF